MNLNFLFFFTPFSTISKNLSLILFSTRREFKKKSFYEKTGNQIQCFDPLHAKVEFRLLRLSEVIKKLIQYWYEALCSLTR